MEFKWRKWNRAIHRDLGYFFAAMSVIYGLSGIALNHLDDWNPSYFLYTKDIKAEQLASENVFSKADALRVLESFNLEKDYRKFYFRDGKLRIIIKGGSVEVDPGSGNGYIEQLRRRPIFYEVNFLHYNRPRALWTWFSDIFAGAMVVLAITGLFILKGKNGITRRGAWLTAAGLIVPLVFLYFYL
jgi:uncharacterized protein